MAIKYSQKELDYIYDNYVHNNKTTVQIAKEINRSQSGVERALKRMQVDVSAKSKELRLVIPITEYNKICQLYQKNYTTEEIAKMYNVVDHTIAKILYKCNVQIRQAAHRSIITHHDIFKVVDTPEKAYWLGWLLTDGSVVENHTREGRSLVIAFSLQVQDKYIVENFAKFVGADITKVKVDNRVNQQAYFRFSSQTMAEDLAKYNVIPHKTGKQSLPKLADALMPYLLRGIFEGNGSVYISKGALRTAFYGGHDMINDIARLLDEVGVYTPHAIIKRGIISSYHISSRIASYKLFQYIYNDISNNTMICQRKYDKFVTYYEQ